MYSVPLSLTATESYRFPLFTSSRANGEPVSSACFYVEGYTGHVVKMRVQISFDVAPELITEAGWAVLNDKIRKTEQIRG